MRSLKIALAALVLIASFGTQAQARNPVGCGSIGGTSPGNGERLVVVREINKGYAGNRIVHRQVVPVPEYKRYYIDRNHHRDRHDGYRNGRYIVNVDDRHRHHTRWFNADYGRR